MPEIKSLIKRLLKEQEVEDKIVRVTYKGSKDYQGRDYDQVYEEYYEVKYASGEKQEWVVVQTLTTDLETGKDELVIEVLIDGTLDYSEDIYYTSESEYKAKIEAVRKKLKKKYPELAQKGAFD